MSDRTDIETGAELGSENPSARVDGASTDSGEKVYFSTAGNLGLLRLGLPDEKIVLFTLSRMRSLSKTLDEIALRNDLAALIITGAGPHMFCAGVDVHIISGVTDLEIGSELAREGQEIFNKIEALQIPTIAAISGPCVGGGFELTLACKYRVATALEVTRVGLPEVKIGILPGFGGTQRLPRLVGIERALDVIIKAKVLAADQAKRQGLIDHLIPVNGKDDESVYSDMMIFAREVALGQKTLNRSGLTLRERLLTHTPPGRSLVRRNAVAGILKETKGHYPAPLKALDSVLYGLKNGQQAGLKEERKLCAELVISPECKSLVHLFFITDEAAKLSKSIKGDIQGASVSVLGGGVMGAGIAASMLLSGSKVTVVEPIEAVRAKAKSHIEGVVQKRRSLSDKKKQEILGKLTVTEDLTKVAGSNFVIEAIIEDLATKAEVFKKVAAVVSPQTILATNTSSLSVEALASALEDQSRVIGLHFFNPAEKMPLVEIVRAKMTSDKSVIRCAALVSNGGKYPVIVEDVPGFLVNRILSPYLIEAASLLAEGYGVAEIDSAITGFGMPMGPLRLLDEVGLDVAGKVASTMVKAYGERMKGPNFAETLASIGRLGRKNGTGFYTHTGDESVPDPQIRSRLGITNQAKSSPASSQEIVERLMLAMVNEAVLAHDEGVAGLPSKEAAAQVDLATVMGMGFPPFRGGVLFYAETLGAKEVLQKLEGYQRKLGARFQPAPGIKKRAEQKKSFFTAVK